MKIFFKGILFGVLFFSLSNFKVFADEFDIYVVKSGDTLYGISKDLDIPIKDLIALNPNLKDPDKIYIGEKVKVPTENVVLDAESAKVLELINIERAKNDLMPVSFSKELSSIAKVKGDDMYENKYFGHVSKKFGDLKNMLKIYDVKYASVGENLAKGYDSAEKVFKAWMKSDSHKKNILYPAFDKIGVYFIQGENDNFWVSDFIKSE